MTSLTELAKQLPPKHFIRVRKLDFSDNSINIQIRKSVLFWSVEVDRGLVIPLLGANWDEHQYRAAIVKRAERLVNESFPPPQLPLDWFKDWGRE